MRSAWLAPLGALLALALAIAAAYGFIHWRTSEQVRVLRVHTDRCRSGQQSDCDWLRTACTKHAGKACLALAESYHKGWGVVQSDAEALALAEEGCQSREAEACLLGGNLLKGDHSSASDQRKAVKLFEHACALGNQRGCALARSD